MRLWLGIRGCALLLIAAGVGCSGSKDGGAPGCTDNCTEGVSQCVGALVQTCAVQPNGCADWNAAEACPGDKACNAGVCPTCTDACALGETQCSGTDVQACAVGTDGCTTWGAAIACPAGAECSDGSCASCSNPCVAGETQCSGDQVSVCELRTDGCLDWGIAADCPQGQTCRTGACEDVCTTLNAIRCNGNLVERCVEPGQWLTEQTCRGSCDPATLACCTDTCLIGDTQCDAVQVRTCELQADGCAAWSAPADCAQGQVCQVDHCDAACAAFNQVRCNGNLVERCAASGRWETDEVCRGSCDPVMLSCCRDVCLLDATQCSDVEVQTCALQSNGCADWTAPTSCPSGQVCQGSACDTACTSINQLRCNGNLVQRCAPSGQWQTEQTCSGSCDPQTFACSP